MHAHTPPPSSCLPPLHPLLLTTVVEVHVPKPYLGDSVVAIELLGVEAGLASLQPQLDPADLAAALEHHAVQAPAMHQKTVGDDTVSTGRSDDNNKSDKAFIYECRLEEQ